MYPTLIEKTAALGFSLINNHSFVDGNKRIGHAVMMVFLNLNGYTIRATVDEHEDIIMRVATGEARREELLRWLYVHAISTL